jgi:glycine cleavage system P protein (glycine dehydrogenase) subunit 1
MRFIPHTEADLEVMLKTVGVAQLDDLIADVPEKLRATAAIKLRDGRAEAEVATELAQLASSNPGATGFTSFLGGGYYRHYVPAAVRAITARAEFATSYTPYQPEVSQGTTQAIFEFQTLITQLTALDVANASMYDGASAAAEAILMAHRVLPKRHVVATSRALWPDYRATIRTYLSALGMLELVELPFNSTTGEIDHAALEGVATDELLCTITGYPNAFGVIEPLARIAELTHRAGGLAISVTAEPLALALLKPPGALGVDIAVGEGQSFGMPVQYGGPGLGFLAARAEQVRQMPGRLVGQTRDSDGHRAFCLTLATREQHIRRERATSNICTNHSLCALAATAYLSLMGRQGLRELAARNVELAHAACEALAAAGIRRLFSGQCFNEFVVAIDAPEAALAAAERHGILAGLSLSSDYPELDGALLISVTEMNTPAEIERLCDVLAGGR